MSVLNIILSHQSPPELGRTLQLWEGVCERKDLLLAYGGMDSNFASIAHQPKIFVDDHRLRTRDHQREKQSYTAVVKAASAWMREVSHPASYVNFTEFDQLPLVKDLNQRQIICLEKEGADLLGHHLERIDGTSHPHYLYQQAHPEFQCWIDGLSHRKKHDVVLAMLATGSFWTRECFDAVAEVEEPLPIYVEVYLPTVAHHLGFRVRGYGDQDGFVSPHQDRSYELEGARLAGAWTVHPVKRIPKTATALR